MSVYYQDDYVTLYHGDCREILPTLERDSVHAIVTDPPYGIDYKSNWGSHSRIAGDAGDLDVPACLTLASKALRRSRHAYIFGPLELTEGTPFTATVELIWDKGMIGMGDLSLPWGRSHEPITFSVYDPSKVNRDKGKGGLAARLRQGSVLRVQRTTGGSTMRHPTEKPVPLLRQLIESSSVFGETILDPFVGVGSTLVAATLEGRKSVGIELEEKYCEAAVIRLKRATALLRDAA